MKKLFTLLLAAVFVLALSACEESFLQKDGLTNQDGGSLEQNANTGGDNAPSGEGEIQDGQSGTVEQPANDAEQGTITDTGAGKTDSQTANTNTGTSTGTSTKTAISRDKALEIALNKAGLKKSDVHDLDIELDKERGINVWEVDFDYQNKDYSYDINAETGAIIKAELERDD